MNKYTYNCVYNFTVYFSKQHVQYIYTDNYRNKLAYLNCNSPILARESLCLAIFYKMN